MDLPEKTETDADGARIWRGDFAQAIFNFFFSLIVIPASYFFARWMIASFRTAATPPFVQGLAFVFGYAVMAAFIIGGVYGLVSAAAVFFDRRPMLRIDDAGIAVRNYAHPRDFIEPRLARWSEINDMRYERAKERGDTRVVWTIFIYLNRENGRSVTWRISAPALGVESKPLFALLEREWLAHGGRRVEA